MQQLEAIYFSGRSEAQLRKLSEAWYRTFANVDVRDFTEAIEQYKNGQEGQREPRPAAIYWLANEARQHRMIAQRPMMAVKFGPLEHQCCPKVEQARQAIVEYKKARFAVGEARRTASTLPKVSEPRAFLALIESNAYEAIHVECVANKARCPFCGREFIRMVNPMIIWLAKKYPKQTENWIPYFKGTVVCAKCDALLKSDARIVTESKPAQSPDYKAKAAGNHEFEA
jgi:hypothetical protein